MTIKEVCTRFGVSADTLRYYERVGVIPAVARTEGGIRSYTDEDIGWIENAVCLREAGVPIEMIITYVELFRQGDETFAARRDLLIEAREKILEARSKYDTALEKLAYKISKYEQAVETGRLDWDAPL